MTTEGIIKTSKLSRYHWRYHCYPGDHRNARSWWNCRVRCFSRFQYYDILYRYICRSKLYIRVKSSGYWRYQLVRGPGGPIECKYDRARDWCIICTTSIRVGSISKCTQTISSTMYSQNQRNPIMEICARDICNRTNSSSASVCDSVSQWNCDIDCHSSSSDDSIFSQLGRDDKWNTYHHRDEWTPIILCDK